MHLDPGMEETAGLLEVMDFMHVKYYGKSKFF
jgi:hypothetical protein